MKRFIYFVLSSLLISSAALAQNTSITIGTNPSTANGPEFLVDGTLFANTQVFVWPIGSVHTVQFPFSLDQNGALLPYQSQLSDNIRFAFGGWVASNSSFEGANNPVVTLVADPSLTSFIATVSETVSININFGGTTPNPNCGGAPNSAPAVGAFSGIIYVGGACVGNTLTEFVPAGPLALQAFPYPGWVFTAWDISGNYVSSAITSWNVTAPITITPEFTIAKRVNFLTNPLGLRVQVDGAPINTPINGPATGPDGNCTPDYTRIPPGAPAGFTPLCIGEFDFAPGSTHVIGAPTPQQDNMQGTWVFNAFDNGLGQKATYVAPRNTDVADTITGNFVAGIHVTLYTIPAGFKIMVDGTDNLPGYTFIWGVGQPHQVAAETPQTDSKGRVWSFTNWSDGGALAHTITAGATNGLIVAANYAELSQITFNSSIAGMAFTVDGSSCATPCSVSKANGATSTVSIPTTVPFTPGARYDFTGWSDGVATTTRTVTFAQNSLTVTANYTTSYQLTTASNPAAGGTFILSPPTPDGYFLAGTQVNIAAVAALGYKFAHWTGALAGSISAGSVQMNGPQAVVADYATVPYISPAGIQSATGPTVDGSVAAGSIISIYGQSLAPTFMLGTSPQLSQTVNGTAVTVGSFILPLVYVSPNLISAQVPWELGPGNYTLTVNTQGQDPIPGQFTVSRYSPAIFIQADPLQRPLVLALHQDGSLVTFSSPAIQGEQISIYGTGFGPYVQPATDGFPASPPQTYNLAGALVLNGSAGPIPTDFAGAADGIVGVAVVKVTIGSLLPPGTTQSLTISVNGATSMPFVLPLQ